MQAIGLLQLPYTVATTTCKTRLERLNIDSINHNYNWSDSRLATTCMKAKILSIIHLKFPFNYYRITIRQTRAVSGPFNGIGTTIENKRDMTSWLAGIPKLFAFISYFPILLPTFPFEMNA